MSLQVLKIIFCFLVAATLSCSKKESETAVQSDHLTDQQKTEIAAQVLRGERPKSDLEKYGITIGEPKEMSLDDFQKQLAKEKAASSQLSK